MAAQAQWVDAYRDVLPEGATPLYGVRVGVALSAEGRPSYVWKFDNAEDINGFELAGVLAAMSRQASDRFLAEQCEGHDLGGGN